jgi:excisionase family DNA binding protein
MRGRNQQETQQVDQAPAGAPVIERKTVSVEDAGKMLGLSRATAYEAARAGSIPVIRIGRRVLVPMAALDRLLNSV